MRISVGYRRWFEPEFREVLFLNRVWCDTFEFVWFEIEYANGPVGRSGIKRETIPGPEAVICESVYFRS